MDQPKIIVAIRKRPLSKKEGNKGQSDIISIKNNQTVIVSQYKQKVDLTKYLQETVFNFDFGYHQNTTNQEIYESAVRPLVDSAFQGAKVTCFAYGQTGSGKTYTMNGNPKMGVKGLYALGAQDIFGYLTDPNFQHLKAKLSFFQIYCGKLFDLLNKRQQLKILEDKKSNINIIGLQQSHVTSWKQFLQKLEQGSTQRITSQNSANSQSSRSHAILQISLKDGKKLFGKISFIDLAGNQRGADHTDMKKQTRIDGAQINKSLLSLKECIRALDQGKGHTPFRGSKLTMVLKDSFTGFCRTLMIGNVSPSSACSENTLNTLRYADRVKQLRKPTQNVTKQELKAREMMLPRQNKNILKINIDNDDDAQDIEAKRHVARGTIGIKEEKRQRSNDPYIFKQQQQRPRQQSFGNGKNQMKTSQVLDPKKQRVPTTNIPQPPPTAAKQIKQPNNTNTAKINMIGNKKPMINEKNVLPRSNSMQPELPKPNFQYKSSDMDIQEQYYPHNVNKNKQINNFVSNQSTNYSSNTKMGHQIEVKNLPLLQKNNSDTINFRSNNYHSPITQNYPMSNSQFYSNHQAHKQYNRNQPQQLVIPNNWNDMDQFIKNCHELETIEVVKERMHEILLNEENDLMSNHSDSLRTSLDIIKSQMNMLGALQNDKDTLTTREYIRFMQQSIDEKISVLQMLRQRMAQFSYKLDTMEEIEDQEVQKRGDDEQLLDDLS